MTDIQKVEYSMLCRLTKILDEHNIRYWIAYGTVLGAVRHRGFIPWDDDVDIYIDGKELKKIQNLFYQKEIDYLRFDDYTTRNYPFTFPKIVDTRTELIEERFDNVDYLSGVYIDVFPLYTVSSCSLLRKIGYLQRYLLYVLIESQYGKPRGKAGIIENTLVKILKKFKCQTKIQKILYKRYSKGISYDKKYVSEPLQFNDRSLHLSSHFVASDKLLFETKCFDAPINPQKYLTDEYGDYMQLPPPELRTGCHNFSKVVLTDLEGR